MENQDIGLTPKEAREFSVARLMRALAEPEWGHRHAGFELAASKATGEAFGLDNGRAYLPNEIRALTASGGVASGGAVVQTDIKEPWYAPALRNASKIGRLGATFVTSSDSVTISRLDTGGQAVAVAENAAPSATDPTLAQATYTPSTITNNIVASRRLLTVTGTMAETVVRRDLIDAVVEKIDFFAVQGTGTNQPQGLIGTASVPVVSLGANGGAPTYASVVDCARQVGLLNGLKGNLGWLTNSKAARTMQNVTKTASWGFLWDDPLVAGEDGRIIGYSAQITESVPSNRTKGAGTNLSALLFGDWSELWVVQFSPVGIIADPYSLSNTGAVRFNVFQEVDIKPRRTQSFAIIQDMVAA